MDYSKDFVVEEVRKVRINLFKEFNYNTHEFGKYLSERERLKNKKSIIKRKAYLKAVPP
jgi:hypothetical protein